MYGVKAPEGWFCDHCAVSKGHRLPYSNSLPKATFPLEVVHSDLSGKISVASEGGGHYYFKLTDAYTN